MPIQIGINNAIKGGTGTGTGGGGGGAVFTDVFDVTTLAGETVSFYTVRQTAPAIVDWGDGSPTETINLSVLQTHAYPAGSYVISISGGAVELSFNARGGQSDLSKVTNVLSLSKLIFGESSSLYTCPVNVTYTATDTPGLVTGETSMEESTRWFPTDADNYPNSIPNWQVGSVNYFESCFELAIASPPSTLDVDVSSWVFKTGAVHYSSFQYLIDARIAECFVGWDASGVTNVTLDNAFRPRLAVGGVDLDPATYPAAKVAYDNLINTKGWVDNGSVNWVTPTPPPNLLLDDYPLAEIAYSVRKLRTAYSGSAMRVRRTVAPFDEQDIGFDGVDLDEAAIVSFGGADPLTVSVWYDQSTNGVNAAQSTATEQPVIYDGSAVITKGGNPALSFETNLKYLQCASGLDFSDISVSSVYSDINGGGHILGMQTSNNNGWRLQAHSTGGRIRAGGTNVNSSLSNVSIHTLQTAFAYGGNGTTYINQTGSSTVSASIGTTTSYNSKIGVTYNPGSYSWAQGKQQEVVIWDSSSVDINDRTGIESNVNTYFSIY